VDRLGRVKHDIHAVCCALLIACGCAAQTTFLVERRELKEASGVVASRSNPGWLWTHNDSGGGSFLYAIDAARRVRLRLKVRGSKSFDWEDVALAYRPGDKDRLIVADTGRNISSKKAEPPRLWIVPEPSLADAGPAPDPKAKLPTLRSPRAHCLKLRFPDKQTPDVEAMFVFPAGGHVGLIAKNEQKKAPGQDRGSAVFVAALPDKTPADKSTKLQLRQAATLRLPGKRRSRLVTGAAVTRDGRLLVLTYTHLHLVDLPPRSSAEPPTLRPVASRKLVGLAHAEGVAVLDATTCLVACEGRPARFTVVRLPHATDRPGGRE
jgi:hypothetical protein